MKGKLSSTEKDFPGQGRSGSVVVYMMFTRAAVKTRILLKRCLQSYSKANRVDGRYFGFVLFGGVAVTTVYMTGNHITENAASFDINKVKKDITTLIEVEDEKKGDGTSIAPTLVRLAWHASGAHACLIIHTFILI